EKQRTFPAFPERCDIANHPAGAGRIEQLRAGELRDFAKRKLTRAMMKARIGHAVMSTLEAPATLARTGRSSLFEQNHGEDKAFASSCHKKGPRPRGHGPVVESHRRQKRPVMPKLNSCTLSDASFMTGTA